MSESDFEDEDEDDISAIVVDNGSSKIAVGFGGDDAPKIIYDYHDNLSSTKPYPIQHGIIENWAEMEKIWKQIFINELKIQPEEHPILLTECMLNPKKCREKMTKIMFETFNVPAMYVAADCKLILYALGRNMEYEEFVIDCGYEKVQTVPIYEAYALHHACLKSTFGGKQCIDYLAKLIYENNPNIGDEIAYHDLKLMMEKYSYIANDYDAEMNKRFGNIEHIIPGYLRDIDNDYYDNYASMDIENICMKYSEYFIKQCKMYELPDGRKIKLGIERTSCVEGLFQPKLFGKNEDGIHQQIYNSIKKCGSDIQRGMLQNITLIGGTSMLPNLRQRLYKEIVALIPSSFKVKIFASPQRKYQAWIGGSSISSLSTFVEMWITRKEYDESGPSIVHRKCF